MTKRLFFLLISLGFFSVTFAQEDDEVDSVEVAEEEEEVAPEEVVVTGSRIARSEYEVSQPVTIIYGEEYENRGYTNASEALFDVPGVEIVNTVNTPLGDFNNNQASGGIGQSLASNFGIGSGRTLVLVNGKRFVSGISPGAFASAGFGNAVDINNIPSALIERVEIVNAGGSAVYGADGIAGVMNFILRDDYEGQEFNVVYDDYAGLSSDLSVQYVFGGNFNDGRGNITVSYQFEEIGTVYSRDVERIKASDGTCPTGGGYFRNYDGPSYQRKYMGPGSIVPISGVATETGCVNITGLPFTGKLSIYPYPFVPGHYGVWYLDGALGPDGVNWVFSSPGNLTPQDTGLYYGHRLFSFDGESANRDFNDLYRPGFERQNFSMFANYDISDNLQIYFNAVSNTFFATDYGQGNNPYSYWGFSPGIYSPVYIPIDYPYLTQNSRDIISGYGLSGGYLSKSHEDLFKNGTGVYGADNRNNVVYFAAGARGDFSLGSNLFSWESGYQYGRTQILSDAPDTIGARYAAALDVGINPDTGEIDCKMNYDPDYDPWQYEYIYGGGYLGSYYNDDGTPTNEFPLVGLPGDCVPLNILGRGTVTQAARDYIGSNRRNLNEIEQELTYVNVTGDLFELPSGASVGFAAGYEARVEGSAYIPDTMQQLGLGWSIGTSPVSGNYEVDAFYYEVKVPLVTRNMDIPFVEGLTLDFSARTVENSLAGDFDVEALSLAWAVTDDLRIRYSDQTALKAPDIGDLFGPQQSLYAFASDPCDYRFIGQGRDPATRRANCAAEGIPANFTDPNTGELVFASDIVTQTARGVTGGNPNLFNETAATEAIGLVYQPAWFGDLLFGDIDFAVDYIKINLEDFITSFSVTQIMNSCYDFTDYPNAFCDRFQRDAEGQVVYFEQGLVNAGLRNFATYVWKSNFAFDVAEAASFLSGDNYALDLGRMAVRWRAFQEVYDESASSGLSEDLASFTGQFGNDEWFYDTVLEYSYKNWYAWVSADTRSGGKIDIFQDMENQPDAYLDYNENPITEYRGYTTYAGGLGFRASENVTVRVIASNLLDYDGSEEDVFDRELNWVSPGRTVTGVVQVRF
jgi:iron complex outermembrane receptor protein